MTSTTDATGTRQLERVLEIQAPIESVWKALTDAQELMNWFPVEARVTPGEGGSVYMAWEDFFHGESKIEIWEEPTHLRTSFFDEPGEHGEPMATAVDYYLESKDGSTVLRLVHSGIGHGSEWDKLFDGFTHGWRSELASLRHYLEVHPGKQRRVAWTFVPTQLADDTVWERVTGPRGLNIRQDIVPGDVFDAHLPTGDEFLGKVLLWKPGRQLVATVANLDNAFFRFDLDDCGPMGRSAWVWLGTYGISREVVSGIEERLKNWLTDLLGA
ncbi:MAG: SRPBCC domain-containing protein [Phycisphaerales bacterium JB043]